MQRRDVMLALTAMLPAAALAQPRAAPRPNRDLDRRVRQVLDRYQAAWNASDMPAMEALYAPDVHWVNIVGMHWQGREEVSYAHRALFDRSFKGVASTLEAIESIVPAPGGAAIAVARWSVASYRSPSGQVTPATRTRMSLFLVPEGNHLLIAHGANIDIVEAAQRSDPVQQRRKQRARPGLQSSAPPHPFVLSLSKHRSSRHQDPQAARRRRISTKPPPQLRHPELGSGSTIQRALS